MYRLPRADEFGELTFYNSVLQLVLRTGSIFMPEYKTKVPLSIMMSPAGLDTY